MTGQLRRPSRSGTAGDEGFSLLEAMISLFIAAVVFIAFGTALASSIGQILQSRENQQAVDVLNQQVEKIRSLPYASIVMATADLSGDPAVSTAGTAHYYASGAGAPELIAEGTVGQPPAHRFTVRQNGVPFAISEYVTRPTDPDIGSTASGAATDAYKRLTVVATWQHGSTSHTRRVVTLLAPTQRGLPLPRFSFQVTPATQSVFKASPSDTPTLDYSLVVRNLGARDSWDLSASSPGWTYYLDSNLNGVRDVGNTDPTLDENQVMPAVGVGAGSGSCTCTGLMEPNTAVYIVAERTIGPGETGTPSVTFSAVSEAEPVDPVTGVSTAQSATVTATISVGSPVTTSPTPAAPTASPAPAPNTNCFGSGCKLQPYYLYNGDSSGLRVGDTTSLDPMPMTQSNGSLQAVDANYSTESGTGTGRALLPTGASPDTETSPSRVADFRFAVTKNSYTVGGTATVTFYVSCASAGQATFRVALGSSAATTNLLDFSPLASGTATMTTCSTTGLTPLTVGVTFPSTASIAKPRLVTLRIQTTGSSVPVRVMYGSASYPALLLLPQK